MNDFQVSSDIEIVQDLLEWNTIEMAGALGVSRVTLNNWSKRPGSASHANMTAFYSMSFKSGIQLNKIKEQLY